MSAYLGSLEGPSPWARRLGFGGLIPFVVLAAALWLPRSANLPWASFASSALVGYGAVIVSFLGAIHWGLLMRAGAPQPMPSLMWGVVPSLVGWAAVLLGHAAGLALTATMLWVCFAVDRAVYPRYALQAWLPMRLRLTLVASISCLVAALAPLQ